MKAWKKLSAALLCVCLAVPMFGNIASAADGRLLFTDPQGKVGENVDVEMVVRSGEGNIDDVNVTMSYDTSAMEFVSGDGCEADGSGKLTYTGEGDGDGEFRTTLVFRPLKTGEAQLSVSDSSVTLESGDTLNLQVGSSKITVSAADDGSTTAEPTASTSSGTATAATDIVVQVDGTDYNFSEAFTNADIPNGYAETTQTFEGADRKFAANDSGIYLGYLVNSDGEGRFFLYNTEDSTFAPYIELSISDSASIIPLNEPDQVTLPSEYQEANLTVLDQEYPIWSDPSKDRFYLMYALNVQTGEKGLYQYDTQDGTYQSYSAPAAEEDEKTDTVLPGKIGEIIGSYTFIILAAAAVLILLLLILMIVFAVKLVHRNQELDDLYDEYDIPYDDDEEEEEDEEVPAPKKKKGLFGRKAREEEEEDEFDDDYDDDYDEDDEADYDDDDYDEDDEEEEKQVRGRTKNVKKVRKSSDDDDYDIDFIDL